MNTEKQSIVEIALAKLTEEEKMALNLIPKPAKPPKVKKHHKLKVYYMIGDGNGNTDEESIISLNNPFLPFITEALDKLGEIPGHWGIMLDNDHFEGNLKIGNISKFQCDLLSVVIDQEQEFLDEFYKEHFDSHGLENSDENNDFLGEFDGLFRAETEYSFLVYEGYKLK